VPRSVVQYLDRALLSISPFGDDILVFIITTNSESNVDNRHLLKSVRVPYRILETIVLVKSPLPWHA